MPTDKNQRQEEKAQMLECALPIGTVLRSKAGREYKITGVLGAGGFGITYKAVGKVVINKETNYSQVATFAIKEFFMKGCSRGADKAGVLCSSSLRDDMETGIDDFRKEAGVLMKLNGASPHIVMVNEQFEANGTWYYVMDYLDGKSLQAYVDASGGHGLPEQEALSLLLPVARAVALLHEHRLLHLDIKPDNIMLKHDPLDDTVTPVLIDFGLAKHFDKKGRPTSRLIARGATEGYAPLEQYGEITGFSPAMDVYALGATLFFLLTGKEPVRAYEIFSMSVSTFLQKNLPEGVSQSVRTVIERAMQPNVNDRTWTVEEFIAGLEDKKSKSPLPVGYVLHGDVASYVITDVVSSMPVCFVYKARLVSVKDGFKKPTWPAYYIYEWFIREDGVKLERDSYNEHFHPDTQETECLKKQYTEEMLSICADERLDDGSLRKRAFRENGDSWSYFSDNLAELIRVFDKQPIFMGEECDVITNNTYYYVCACSSDSQLGDYKDTSKAGTSGDTVAFEHKKKRFRFKKKHIVIAVVCLVVCFCVYRAYMFYSLPEEPVDYSSLPISELTEKAKEGIAAAQFYLGVAYQEGKGVIQNDSLATYWYMQAAEKGEVAAQHNLGVAYQEGKGVPKDYKMAVSWYKKAAEKGFATAQYNLGIFYLNGVGVSKNDSIAAEWFVKAAKQGCADAQGVLGECYNFGWGVSQDYEKAVSLYTQAAKRGSSSAQFRLGECYELGIGVTKNIKTAKYWYSKAAEQDDKDAKKALERLKSKI